ncbi:ABC transporter substrate-binding protein [Cohnella nanjingensis]|uniref:ABC transporter substrate-binding protein n=1 Tax=Cohnella nanjingensis TaxID=1387779 RepID=A0A7X0RL11_9BACL|nr:ABC transporter substrate-binding protein [Cohnella nanjingensis]MBB6669464.1 ABC transporter substrate-binding protein [Cohnella nanjingensis]
MTKRNLIVSLAAVTLASVIAMTGCSSGSAGTDAANGSPTDSGNVVGGDKEETVNFWVNWGGDFKKDFQKYVIDEFEKKYPNIKVKMTYVEGTDKLLTSIAGGNPPDVAQLDRFMVGSWAAKGSLEDLTSLVERDSINKDDYYPAVWAEANYNDKTYALPWGTDDRAMYYNKTLFKEAGLDPNKPPTTISELDRMAEQIFKKGGNGKYDRVGFIPWMSQGSIYTYSWNWGGKFEDNGQLTLNDPQNVKALEWMAGYAKKYNIANLSSFSNAMGQTGLNPFWTGKVGFIVDGNWILNDLAKTKPQFEWGVIPVPAPDGHEPTTWSGGFSYVMPKGAKHKEAAWTLMKFIAGYDGTLLWAKRPTAGNDITAMPRVNSELKMDENPNLKVFLDLMPNAKFRPVTPVGQKMWDELFRVQDLAINGKGEPQALLDEVKKNIDNELSKITK